MSKQNKTNKATQNTEDAQQSHPRRADRRAQGLGRGDRGGGVFRISRGAGVQSEG